MARKTGKRLWYLRGRYAVLNLPLPWRLPYGVWFLLYPDFMGSVAIRGHYEEQELQFVSRFLQSEMTVFDVGANQGFYTLLMAKRVGPRGRVVAFEPVPTELAKLRRNLRTNMIRNVTLEPYAAGVHDGCADMFACLDGYASFSSLRQPAEDIGARTRVIQVPITSLDNYARNRGIESIHFIKIDVEGGELDVLKGARIIVNKIRPVFMCEVQDWSAQQWGYPASAICEFLETYGYTWFEVGSGGSLLPAKPRQEYAAGTNLVAVPSEKLTQVRPLWENA